MQKKSAVFSGSGGKDSAFGLGFKALVVCVNDSFLDRSFVGRLIDDAFLNDLPATVDPCGENGEYHSFVFDGPIFKKQIDFKLGEIVHRKYRPSRQDGNSGYHGNNHGTNPFHGGFWYRDLLSVS